MTGLWYDEFEVGQIFEHPIRRTITEADNVFFSCLTHNPQPLHIDHEYCATQTEFGRPLVNSLFTLGLMIGISINETTFATAIASLGMTEVKFPHPLFHGDTIHVNTTVIGKRESRSRPTAGIVEFEHTAYNQDEITVASCRRHAFMRKRPGAPD